MLRNLCLAVCLALCSCYGFADPGLAKLLPRAEMLGVHLGELPIQAPSGLSDLTLGELPPQSNDMQGGAQRGRQVLFSIAERKGHLFSLHAKGVPSDEGAGGLLGPRPEAALNQTLDVKPVMALSLVRSNVDFESLAAIAPHQLAIGTESNRADRQEDLILLVDHDESHAKVTRTLSFPYALWDMRAAPNEGIEAMCALNGTLLAASESVKTLDDNTRVAPLGQLQLPDGAFRPYFVELTSSAGRISAMTCVSNARGDEIEVIAIERHFGVGRLIRFVVPQKKPGPSDARRKVAPMRLAAEVLVDLSSWVRPLPNFEGIVRLPHGELLLLSDNDTGGAARPAYVLTVPPRAFGKRTPSF